MTPETADSKTQNALVYGMQRTGTNYTQQLLSRNFGQLQQCNDGYSRCLPTQKHFRLYAEKYLIPEAKYLNTFEYPHFTDFKAHVEGIVQQDIGIYIVTIKNPYSWYISYKKHAKRNAYISYKRYVNSHFIIDYNLYYKKWLDFSREAPDQVLMIRYEDLIMDLDATLDRIAATFHLTKNGQEYHNPDKVPMSKKFSQKRREYYENQQYLEQIRKREKYVIDQLLDPDLMQATGYLGEQLISIE